MKLSDAIEKGVYGLGSPGPSFDPHNDVFFAAFRGFFGRDPTESEACQFYGNKQFGFPSDTEYALRLMTIFGLRWSEVLQRLRGMGQ